MGGAGVWWRGSMGHEKRRMGGERSAEELQMRSRRRREGLEGRDET